MEAAMIRERPKARRTDEVWRCGWCKGFVTMRRVSDMQRWTHEEKPATDHEVLPYRVG